MASSFGRFQCWTSTLAVLNLPVMQPDRYSSAGGLGGYCVVKFMVLSNPE